MKKLLYWSPLIPIFGFLVLIYAATFGNFADNLCITNNKHIEKLIFPVILMQSLSFVYIVRLIHFI